jgi:hypothetical protein
MRRAITFRIPLAVAAVLVLISGTRAVGATPDPSQTLKQGDAIRIAGRPCTLTRFDSLPLVERAQREELITADCADGHG